MIRNASIAILIGLALAGCSTGMVESTAKVTAGAPTERGQIVGWQGGDAVLYATVGFFSPHPQIVAVGPVSPDGTFVVDYPATLPRDVLAHPAEQCSTIQASNPAALTAFSGNDLIFQQGTLVGSVHSGSSIGVASFTSIAAGDTRTGYVYTTEDTSQTGYCERSITFGKYAVDFRQNFALRLHKGWNTVVADFSTPRAGFVVSDLKVGSNPAEKFYFFGAPGH